MCRRVRRARADSGAVGGAAVPSAGSRARTARCGSVLVRAPTIPARGGCWFGAEPVVLRRSCSLLGAATGCVRRFCAEPQASAALGPAADGAGAGMRKPASAEPAAWWGVRSLLRSRTSGTRWFCAEPVVSRPSCSLPGPAAGCARWFCAEPPASATLAPAAGGAGAGKPASAEPAAWRGVRSPLGSGTSGRGWFGAEPVVLRRSWSLPGPGTGCA